MRRTTVVWLVARREIIERGRSRGYVISLAFTLVLLIAGFVLPALVMSDSTTLRLALVGDAPPGLQPALTATAKAFDAKLDLSAVPDHDAAVKALAAKTIDGALEVPADLSSPGTFLVQQRADSTLQAIASNAVIGLRAGSAIASPTMTVLDPPKDSDTTAIIFANAGIILMFIGIFTYGTWVLTGVVEEKQSRVVEVILSTVRPRDLLMGKVMGIGVLAIAQLVVLVSAGIAASQISGRLVLPPTTAGAVIQLLTWFILGFALYSTALGSLGALASRPDEANNAAMPVTMSATLIYIVSIIFVAQEPSGVLARVMTFVPLSAPMVVPLRAALGAIDPWEVAVSIVVMIAAIFLLFEAGARVYAGAVLQGGGRMKLRDAWRASR
jgi:ABC-2 type transport system permease protein